MFEKFLFKKCRLLPLELLFFYHLKQRQNNLELDNKFFTFLNFRLFLLEIYNIKKKKEQTKLEKSFLIN